MFSRFHPLYHTDSYKVTHWPQYPPNTEYIYSYFESRGGEFDQTVFFGLQYFLNQLVDINKWLRHETWREQLDEAKGFYSNHFGADYFNYQGWQEIGQLGYLPVSIRAVPEGWVVPTKNVLFTIQNTDPRFYWLPNWLETFLSQMWYPITVATNSFYMKKVLKYYLEETGDPLSIDYKLHDFGFRGVSSLETAAIGGAAHLVNFKGTDTIPALQLLRSFYDAPMAGNSIPASEHSTITSWGRNKERQAFRNMLDKYPSGTFACVSDSYNIFDACRLWASDSLKTKIEDREGVLVIRPDSGDPVKVILECLKILAHEFGSEKNKKGYVELNPKVRLIQGDGIDLKSMDKILAAMQLNGWSANNIAFGSGGALLQKFNRDTCKFAFKCSAIKVAGEARWRNVFKKPITDPGKESKLGKLLLLRHAGKFVTVRKEFLNDDDKTDLMVEVFRDGVIKKIYTLDEIRKSVNLVV
jgi:nicotinamide phosphoribosyltransferase